MMQRLGGGHSTHRHTPELILNLVYSSSTCSLRDTGLSREALVNLTLAKAVDAMRAASQGTPAASFARYSYAWMRGSPRHLEMLAQKARFGMSTRHCKEQCCHDSDGMGLFEQACAVVFSGVRIPTLPHQTTAPRCEYGIPRHSRARYKTGICVLQARVSIALCGRRLSSLRHRCDM